MKIAFFGTGLMGSGFIRRLRARGHDVNVWNRSAAKARALEPDGARVFDDPAAALVGAERIHLSLCSTQRLRGTKVPSTRRQRPACPPDPAAPASL